MKILSIETSCDETALALLDIYGEPEDLHISSRAAVTLSQIDIHKEYGGVFPALAKREHAKNIIPLLEQTLKNADDFSSDTRDYQHLSDTFSDIFSHEKGLADRTLAFLESTAPPSIDAVAVTYGPGLEPALWVGLNIAKALSLAWNVPLVPVDHIEGHIASALFDPKENKSLPSPAMPSLALIISGGHTEFVSFSKWGSYSYLGGTVDDAVGEAYDKVARMLDLPYPGGPPLSRLASVWRKKNKENPFTFPRPMKDAPNLDLSFSGLKTSVLYAVRNRELTDEDKEAVAAAFEDAVADVLLHKTKKALEYSGARSCIVCGGVSANMFLREQFEKLEKETSVSLHIPDVTLSTDNATMIAIAGYIQHEREGGLSAPYELIPLRVNGNAGLE